MANKTVTMALTNKDADLARVPAQNSGDTRRMALAKIDTVFSNLNWGSLGDIFAVELADYQKLREGWVFSEICISMH